MRNRLVACLLLLFLLAAVQFGSPRTAAACSCAPKPTVQDALNNADLVFSGTVTSAHKVQYNFWNSTFRTTEATIQVTGVWKGKVGPQVTIASESCGSGFRLGHQYLVYGLTYRDGPAFTLLGVEFKLPVGHQILVGDFCGRTQLFSTALQDLVELGPPSQPAQPGLLDLLLDNLLAVVAGLFALIIAIILYLIRRKRRRTFRLKP